MSGPSKPTGVVVYRGASELDGAPIVAVLTGLGRQSSNAKTGGLLQLWILPDSGSKPHETLRNGEDAAVCGDCPHRPATNGSCYVRVYNAPRSVYAAYQRDRYPALGTVTLPKRGIRLGAWGDPAALPFGAVESLLKWAQMNALPVLGYTHQWRTADVRWKACLMASADALSEAREARALGWRTFRVRRPDEPLLAREAVCPASVEANHATECAACKACDGNAGGRRNSIAIMAHGSGAKAFANASNIIQIGAPK
ncbi:MAG: hypothetical protein GY871_03985 [Actinomycetales bacterium]|nr:hypothetical protein [Actinomycetales bacterium]